MKTLIDLHEDLRKWFSKTDPAGDWKRINTKGEVVGPCAREPGEPKPKCMSRAKRESLTKKERASAVRAKRKHDPDPERKGSPINVSNFGKGKISENMENLNEKNVPTNPELWSRAKSLARSKFDVYPSAYANGWASKWYKGKGGSWKSVSEAKEIGDDPINDGTPPELRKRGNKTVITSDEIKEAVKNKLDIGEYDQEGDMAKSDLRSIMANAQKLHDMIEDADNLPEWCQNKITLAEDYISTVANYLTAEMNESDVYGKPTTAKTPTVTLKHKTSGKEIVVVKSAAPGYKKIGYHMKTEEFSKTGKEATHNKTGEKTYEYAKVDKEGRKTGEREYRNAQGKPMGEEIDTAQAERTLRAKDKSGNTYHVKDKSDKVISTHNNQADAIRGAMKNDGHRVVKEEFAGYIAHYNGQKHEIKSHEAKDLYDAKQKPNFEEVEHIDELSKRTLARYAKKATSSMKMKQMAATHLRDKHRDASDKHQSGVFNRETGIKRAIDKLAGKYYHEEVEQIDEISRDLADRYVSKVTQQQVQKQGMQPNMYDKLPKNRQQGVSNALKRTLVKSPVKEETEQIDEISSALLKKYDDASEKKHTTRDDNTTTSKYASDRIAKNRIVGAIRSSKRQAGFKGNTDKVSRAAHYKAIRSEEVEQIEEQLYKQGRFVTGAGKKPFKGPTLASPRVEESRGHKVLATFMKNREVAQRAFTGQNKPVEKPKEEKKPVKESRKAEIIKNIMKKKKSDQFEAEPELSNTQSKSDQTM